MADAIVSPDRAVGKIAAGIPKPRFILIDGVAFVTSLTVAEAFGKPHERVLQLTANMLVRLAAKTLAGKDWGNRHCRACESGCTPMYRFTREGFIKLVRCFSGRKTKIKNLYLAAFDAVEGRAKPEAPPQAAKTSMPALAVSQQPGVFAGALQGRPALLVDARDLHASLAVGREFAHWIREKIVDYGYVADQDYIKVLPAPPVPRGRQPLAFHLGLEMAKDLTAIDGSTKAKMVKRYLQRYDRHLQTLDVLGMSAYPHGGGKVEQAWDSKEGRLVDLRTGVPVAAESQVSAEQPIVSRNEIVSAAPTVDVPPMFRFETGEIRAHTDDKGNPWFCAADICAVLGYTNDSKAIGDHCRKDGVTNRYPIVDKLGRKQFPNFINEGNLYRLIIKSRKPEAEKFEKWVMDELLPTIRKTGRYEIPQQTAKPAPVPAAAPLLPGLNVGEEDFFQAAYDALGRENGMATLLVQLVKMGAFNQWVSASLRGIAEASGDKISKTNIAYNAKRLADQGLIDRKSSQWYVFGEVLRALLPGLGEAGEEGSLLANSGIACDKITVH